MTGEQPNHHEKDIFFPQASPSWINAIPRHYHA
jgi:hypothetical protein